MDVKHAAEAAVKESVDGSRLTDMDVTPTVANAMSDEKNGKDDKLPTDTGWKPIIQTGGDGHESARGKIEMIKGNERKPCMLCTSWEKDERRLVQHLIARGLKPNPDGTFTSPIARDVKDKTPMIMDPKRNGFCRREGSVTEDLASCEKWQPVSLVRDLARRIKR